MDNPTFDKVRDLSTKFYRELPQTLQDELFEALNRGIDILDSEPQMTAYLFAFGKMHQAKLTYAFDKLPKEFFEQPEINIIDYGCGQALGTMCYADFLHEKGYSQKVKNVTLIEPSEICLKRAALHASVFFPDAEIKTVNKKFDDLTQDDIVCTEGTPTLHILSNVLDMLNFNLERFAELVNGCLKGFNQFVCVGPYFNFYEKDDRMKSLCSLLEGNANYSKVFDKYEFEDSKTWTAQLLCFSIGKLTKDEISTEVTDKDIENGVKDELGVFYSKDGKRLLMCENNIENYSVKEGTIIICDYAFSECVSLKEIIIPETVESIGVCAFAGCSSLRQIKFPKSLSSIGNEAFSGCSSLTQLLIPPTWSLGDYVFCKCTSLKQVIIPDFTISEKEGVFYGCKSLQQVFIDSDLNTGFEFCQGCIGKKAFYECSSLRQVYIPNSIVGILERAFEKCDSLEAFRAPWTLILIGENAFKDCFSLEEVNISNPDCTICSNAFNCGVWMDPIPYATKCFGDHEKKWVEALNRITIPKGTTERFKKMLEERLWDRIVELRDAELVSPINQLKVNENLSTKVTYEDRVNDVQDGWGMYNKDGDKLLCCLYPKSGQLDTFTIKQGTKIICDEAFSSDDCKLKQVCIPESVTHIGDKAFEDCRYLEQIVIPESVISIGNLVFKGCWKLKQITIPHSIKQIGDNPFIAPCLLYSNSDRFIINNEMLIDLYEKRLISYFGKGKDVVIPEIVTKIGNYAFYDCDSIERIIITHKIKSIGDYAFSHSSLQSFCITESIEHIGKNPFEACGVVEELMPWEDPTKRPSVNITSNSGRFIVIKGMIIDKMQNKLITYFENDSMVSIPDDVITICDSAFAGCISVEQITIPDSVTSIGDSAFEYTSIEQITIPNSVTSIGREAFGGCEQLSQINLPNGISTIEEGTFDYCTNLRQITIPNTVKSIGKWAFACCPLTQIKLPKSIEFLGWRIFQGCHSLERIIIPNGTWEKFSLLLSESQNDIANIIEQ